MPDAMRTCYGAKADETLRMPVAISSPFDKQILLDSQMSKHYDSCLNLDQKINLAVERHAIGTERTVSHLLPRALDRGVRSILNTEPPSHLMEQEKINITGSQYENGLFSSSFSEFSGKLRISANNSPFGHSVGAAASCHHDDEEPFVSLKELEARTIGNLLPDDDELLSGAIDGLDCTVQHNNGDDMEELDLFSSVGGMDLGDDGSSLVQRHSNCSGENSSSRLCGPSYSFGAGQSFEEQSLRTLVVRNINGNVEDLELRKIFEQYGDVCSVFSASKHRGFVVISYYDIRAAQKAIKALQDKSFGCKKLDVHFSFSKENPSEKDINQGTIIVFNLDSSVSNDEIRQIFGAYGDIKEIYGTLDESDCKFIEFYDTRAAEAALSELNQSTVAGKQIKVEPSYLVGARGLLRSSPGLKQDKSGRNLRLDSFPSKLTTSLSGPLPNGGISTGLDSRTFMVEHSASRSSMSPLLGSVYRQGVSCSVSNNIPSIARVESLGNHSNVKESNYSLDLLNFEFQGSPNFHPHSLPEYHDGLGNGTYSSSPCNMAASVSSGLPDIINNHQYRRMGSNGQSIGLNDNVFGSPGSGSCPPPGHPYMWSNSQHLQLGAQGMIWPTSPSFVNGGNSSNSQRLHAVPGAPTHILNAILPMNNHHVGSAPSVWDRHHAYVGESPDASAFHPGSLGTVRMSDNSPHLLDFAPHNVFPRVSGNCVDLPILSQNIGLHSHHQRGLMFPASSQMIPTMSSFGSPGERIRNRRNEGSSGQADHKKQFELDIERIMRGEDKRTTLMIKNIPNKYTSKMLLAAIDERHRGTYDFVYLPIDFKNKCNVGYAFINMTDPNLIIPFYHSFNGKRWEKFNSEKVASLAYGRIQGKPALIAHFQNSSLMNEDKRCRPILFHTDGPNAGDQVPFPMGVNVRPRHSKSRAGTSEENNQEGQPILVEGEEYSSGNSSSCSMKDSN